MSRFPHLGLYVKLSQKYVYCFVLLLLAASLLAIIANFRKLIKHVTDWFVSTNNTQLLVSSQCSDRFLPCVILVMISPLTERLDSRK